MKYEKHPRIEGKYQCTQCTYGRKDGRSRQAVSKHHDKMHLDAAEEPEISPVDDSTLTVEEGSEEVKINSEEAGEFTPSDPDWLRIDSGEEEGTPEVASIPTPVKGMLRGLQGAMNTNEWSVDEMKHFFKHQAKMVRFLFSGVVDPLVGYWGKGVTGDSTWSIERTPEEWEMTEEITAQWMEYRGVTVPLNPDILMVGCVGALYVPPIMKARKNADPNRPKWSPFGWLSKWRARRSIRKALAENPLNDREATYGLEP